MIIIIIQSSSSSKDQFLASVNLWHSFVRILGQQVKCEIVESTLCIHFSTFLSVLYCLCSRVRTSGCCPTMNDFPRLHHCQPFHYLVGHHHCLFHHLDHHQVVHDCRNDSAALFFQCDVQVRNVFDTQVMIIIFNRSIMIIMIIFIGIMIWVNFIRNSRL